jgi:long-chain fatty acid transport protein
MNGAARTSVRSAPHSPFLIPHSKIPHSSFLIPPIPHSPFPLLNSRITYRTYLCDGRLKIPFQLAVVSSFVLMTFRYPRLAGALLALLPLGGGAVAGGFQTLPPSAYALGLAGAVTASSRDASCAWFNPGALGMLDSADVSIGLTGQAIRRIFRSSVTTQTVLTEQTFEPGPYLYAAVPVRLPFASGRKARLEARLATLSRIQLIMDVLKANPKNAVATDSLSTRLGISKDAARDLVKQRRRIEAGGLPEELNDAIERSNDKRLVLALSVNSPYGFLTEWPTNWQGRSLVQKSRVQTVFVQPTVAYRTSERFSVGAGLILAGANYQLDRSVGEFADGAASYTASGVAAGWNVGIKGRAGDAVSFGIAYRSAVKIKMDDGKVDFKGIPSSQAFRFPATADFSTRLNLPWQLTAGISNRVTEKLLLNFTFELSGWSAFDSLNIVYANNARPTERGGRRYEDAMAFRVGSEYQYTSALALRCGVYYDESPVRDQNITVDLPDANMLGVCAGAGYQMGRLRVDAAYTFAMSAQRNAIAKPDALTVPAMTGKFRHQVQGGSIGVSYQF